MKFCEAMDALTSGSKVTRQPWKGGVYFFIIDGDVKSFQPKLAPYIYNEDIMVSDGWKISGQEGEYKFCDIIPFLQKSCKVYMKDWKDTFVYFDIQTKGLVIHSMDIFPFIPDFESFVAQDWIIL